MRFLPLAQYYAYRACEIVQYWLVAVSSHGDHPGHGLF